MSKNFNSKPWTPHRMRVLKEFITCTQVIIEKEGLDGVTIRKVAKLSDLNSATIYNYFENLDHLIIFSIMDYIQEYIDDLPNWIKVENDALENFIGVWQCFAYHSLRKPDIYTKLFFSNLNNDINHYIEQYYQIFPIDLDGFPKYLIEMLTRTNVWRRSEAMIGMCVKEGKIRDEDKGDLNNITLYVFEGILRRISMGKLEVEEGEKMFDKYLNKIVEVYKVPEDVN